jgi:hypothetical protein
MSQLTLPLTSYQRPAGFVDSSRRRPAQADAVSRGELLLFRLVERLCRRGRAGCVRTIERLAAMLEKPGKSDATYSERTVWRWWKSLLTLCWIDYRIYRQRGKQYIEFWPLVSVSDPAPRIFLRRKMAPSMAPSTGQNGTVSPHTTDSSELSVGENDNATRADSVVVSPPTASPALDGGTRAIVETLGVPEWVIARAFQGISGVRIRQAARAVSAYLERHGGNKIALLITAVREGWEPPAPRSDARSDRGERPAPRITHAPKGFELGKPAARPSEVSAPPPFTPPSESAAAVLARLGLKSKYATPHVTGESEGA